jgi:hypothetical protein
MKCKICKEWHWSGEGCDPIYLLYNEEFSGDEPHEMRAKSFANAAEKYAEYYNFRIDGGLVSESTTIKIEFEGKTKHFAIGAEATISFWADEIEKEGEEC